uniref:5'-3' exoribonuclease n=1 Tax=Panagrolaimus sp. JU765 TaxID=591449 RepID=A0AC34QF17_9BILA
MGVPSFFRWLQRKYPSIIVYANEEKPQELNGIEVPVDCTKPNPNNQEFDNLYLDMNGIIHPCTHPENRPAPKTEEEMFALIFEYVDRLFAIVRPRRLLYMAIDGVAPRAKMNQQRSRRFRAAKEAAEKEEEIQRIRDKLESDGIPLPPKRKEEEKFDTNCITPGTPFMDRLAVALRYYIHNKVTLDPAWEHIQVILSDANAPGEGEHKIMDFIRRQRSNPEHDPNTVHCLCGADADLIMLGLATHEANFHILREEFVPNQPRPCELCHQYGHELKDCRGLAADEKMPDQADPLERQTNFIFIKLPALREYLERELHKDNFPFEFDLERAIDDWVFMCFFVGNDFLPHLPSLEIREGAIDRLIRLYQDMLFKTRGWLTDAGEVNMKRVEIMMKGLGNVEDEIFRKRKFREMQYQKSRKRVARKDQFMPQSYSVVAPLDKPPEAMSASEFKERRKDERMNACNEAEKKLKSLLQITGLPADDSGKVERSNPWHTFKRAHEGDDSDAPPEKVAECAADVDEEEEEEEEPYDDVRLHEPGWKARYYTMKFGVGADDVEFRRQVASDYVEGLCWVLKYYYQGCVSWDWFYPHHYAPFASDFDQISKFTPDFSKPTKPFNPLEQLMAVFPAASRAHIPKAWHSLMTDGDSPLLEFYPPDFRVDLNGKKFAWQGVALLPFVDQELLLTELAKVYNKLTDEEKRRNIRGPDRIFVSKNHPLFNTFAEVYKSGQEKAFKVKKDAEGSIIHEWIIIDPKLANGMAGEIACDAAAVMPGETYPSIFKNSIIYKDITPNLCMMVDYRDPQYPKGYKYPAIRLAGVIEPESTLKPKSYDEQQNGQYRPNVGFTRDRQYANMSQPGHRMLSHEMNRGGRGRGKFIQPTNYQQHRIEQISDNYSSQYSGHFESSRSRNNGMPSAPRPPILNRFFEGGQPPSFSDMALGKPSRPPYHGNNNRGGFGNKDFSGRGRGGRSNYRGNNFRGDYQNRHGDYHQGNGGPQRPRSQHGHHPYDNKSERGRGGRGDRH